MVRQCVLCKKLDYSNPGLVFRRFPVNPERRQRWISLLDLEDQHIIKYAQICSDQFDQSGIITTQLTGRRQIRPEADPQLNTTVFTQRLSFSSDSTITDTPPRKYVKSLDVDFKRLFETPQCTNLSEVTAEQNVAGPSNVLFKTREDNVRKPLSPVTETIDTASKTENVNKRKRYIGELASSSTPEKKEEKFSICKKLG